MSSLLRAWRSLVAALVLLTGAASAAFAQVAVEQTLVDVRLGQAASLALRADRAGDRLWLPVAALAAGFEVEVVSRSAARVELRRWPSRALIVLDRDSMLARVGTTVVPLAAGALRDTDGELAADAATLQRIFPVQFEVSWTDLLVSVPVIDSMPIGRRIAREKARAQLLARTVQEAREQSVAPLARPIADGAVLDYSLSMPLMGARRELGWSTAAGMDVLGGSLEVSTGAVTGGTRLPTLASWTGVWRAGRKLTQLRLGDGLGGGPQPRLGRGVMLTNAPYARPALFGLQTLRGDLPPGWTIEAYRNGELVAVDTVGRGTGYQLQLPLLYGENPVDLLAVGPFGQTRALTQNLRIMSDLLPQDKAEYSGSMAQCRLRQQCIAAGTMDMRVGLTSRWTMRVGVDALARDSVGWRTGPFLSFVGAPLPSTAVQLDAAAMSRTRLALNIEPSQKLRVSAERQWFGAEPIDPLLAARRRAQSSLYAFWRRLDAHQLTVEANMDHTTFLDAGDLLRARVGVGLQTSAWRLQPYVRHDASSRAGFRQSALGMEGTLLPNGTRGRYLGAALLRLLGEVDARGSMVRQAATLAMPLPGAFRVDAGVALQRGVRGPVATLSLSRDLNSLRSYTNANVASGTASVLQSVQGSALVAPGTRRPQFVTGPSLQRTGATGVVFLDRNANGVRDPGEQPVPDVVVQVGTSFGRSDETGRYRVWDLVPFIPLPVQVDSSSLPSPLWIPTLGHANIEAGPNRFEPLDIPLVAGGVVEGRIAWPQRGSLSLPPVPLVVTTAKGLVVGRTESFSDGEYVLFGVRPGRLTVKVDSAWQERQRVSADSQVVLLQQQDDGATVRAATITLLPPGSQRECAAARGPQCGSGDGDLREGRRAEPVVLPEGHDEGLQPSVVEDIQEQLTRRAPWRVRLQRVLAPCDRRRAGRRGRVRVNGQCARPAPVHSDPEARVVQAVDHADRLKSEWAPLHRRSRDDGRLLRGSAAGKRHGQRHAARRKPRSRPRLPGRTHAPQSRPVDACTRGALPRAPSGAGASARGRNCTAEAAKAASRARAKLLRQRALARRRAARRRARLRRLAHIAHKIRQVPAKRAQAR